MLEPPLEIRGEQIEDKYPYMITQFGPYHECAGFHEEELWSIDGFCDPVFNYRHLKKAFYGKGVKSPFIFVVSIRYMLHSQCWHISFEPEFMSSFLILTELQLCSCMYLGCFDFKRLNGLQLSGYFDI